MGQLVFQATLGGQVNLVGPNTASTLNINVPAFAGTMASLASVTTNGVAYVNSSGQPTSGSAFVFDGTNVGIGVTPATGTPSLIQSYGDITLYGGSRGFLGNVYYQSGWKYAGTGYGWGWIDSGSGNITFQSTSASGTAGGSAAIVERMRIDSSGNLLVGTNSGADFKFKVGRQGNLGIATFINTETSGLTYDQTQIIVGQAAGTGYMFARYYTSAGSAAQFAFRGDGQMFATVTSIASISDARTKENVRESSDGLNTVLGLRAVRFDFKEGFSNNRKNQLGFIAQEIEEVFPDAVDVSGQKAEDGSEYKTVAPSTLIPVLVKAIQEQQALIATLTDRITALESK